MPRSAAGVFTLAENPYTAGSTILSASMNSNLSDIATVLSGSLALNGSNALTGALRLASGSVTAPSLTFSSSTGTGFYLSGSDAISWTAAGVLAATFSATGTTTWVGAATFQSTVAITGALTLSAALALNSTLSIVTGTEPAVTIRNSDNDASEHELTRYALGSGAGATASRRIVGAGANDVTEIRDYIGTTEILRQTASLVSPKKNISLDAGITIIATAGYCDLTEISIPAAPSANSNRIYSKDLSGVSTLFYQESGGTEIVLSPPARTYTEYVDNADITDQITYDDTIPQNTEGAQIITTAITLKKANSRVRLTFTGWGQCATSFGNGDSAIWIGAIFRTGSADALIAAANSSETNDSADDNIYNHTMIMMYEEAPGTVGPHTYTVRVGPASAAAGTLRMNGTGTGRVFGGVARTVLVVEEIYV